jgi:hypothetical protein
VPSDTEMANALRELQDRYKGNVRSDFVIDTYDHVARFIVNPNHRHHVSGCKTSRTSLNADFPERDPDARV